MLPGILLQVWHSLNSYRSVMREYKTALILFIELLNLLIMVSYSLNPTPFEFRGVFFHIFVHLGANFCSFSFKGLYEKPSSILWLQHETKTHYFNKKKSKIILCLYRRVCMQCMQTQIVFLLLLWECWTPTDSISGLKLDQILLRCKGFFKICSHRKY